MLPRRQLALKLRLLVRYICIRGGEACLTPVFSVADGQTAKTGAQADAFNAVFGITTNFAAVPEVSDQGVTLGGRLN